MPATAEAVRGELMKVRDPEIPVNIVDLGLIYDIRVNGAACEVDMTLTSRMCPVAQVLPELVKRRALGVEGIEEVEVNLVWEPAWTQERISPEGRKELGMDEPAG